MGKIKLLWFFVILFWLSCDSHFVPRPEGYPRIDFPQKNHYSYTGNCPFEFEYPVYSKISNHKGQSTMPCWLNIDFIPFKGRLHLSYLQATDSLALAKYMEDTRSLAYKHTIKAHAIDEHIIKISKEQVYGIVYDIKGSNTASSLQFYLTDSMNHFMRGALYFSVPPNNDSLSPVISFVKEDIDHFMGSFRWK